MSKMLCGAAKAVITPKEEWVTYLKCSNMQFGGVLDDILVRAIAVGDGEHTMLFVGFDLDKEPYPVESIAWITENTGIPEENIFLFGTHTHAVPRLGPRIYEPPFNKPKLNEEEQAVMDQYEDFVIDSETYEREIAPARTIAYEKEIEALR